MNASYHQSSAGRAGGATALFEAAAHDGPVASPLDQACCCVARAVVRVVMPPAQGRSHETELLLCGHHYRASRRALSAARARVHELDGSAENATAWFHDDPDRFAQVTQVPSRPAL
jgi:hypothetical protein